MPRRKASAVERELWQAYLNVRRKYIADNKTYDLGRPIPQAIKDAYRKYERQRNALGIVKGRKGDWVYAD